MSTYAVESAGTRHHVIAINDDGRKYIVTTSTPHREMAERWCRDLKRAAQVEQETKKRIRSGL